MQLEEFVIVTDIEGKLSHSDNDGIEVLRRDEIEGGYLIEKVICIQRSMMPELKEFRLD